MILVTGASGQLGQLVIERLLDRVPAAQIVAGVRTLDKGAGFAAKGIQVRVVDYNIPTTLDAALEGIDKVLLISGNELGKRTEQHSLVIEAAKKAGVALVVYTSILKADSSRVILAREHLATEKHLRASGVPFVILRNGWYTENYTLNLAGTVAAGVVLGAAGKGKVSLAARVDYAEAAAVVLTSAGHTNKIYELAGDEALTLEEFAALLSQLSGKPVAYKNLPPEEYAATLAGFGVPKPMAEVLADSDLGIERGELSATNGDLRSLLGRPTTPVASTLQAALA